LFGFAQLTLHLLGLFILRKPLIIEGHGLAKGNGLNGSSARVRKINSNVF